MTEIQENKVVEAEAMTVGKHVTYK